MIISNNVQKWYENMLTKAAHLGQLSDMRRHKIGAILVHKKSIISTGFNKEKSHPLQNQYNKFREPYKRNGCFVHAEIDCLRNLRDIPKDSILFIGRFDKNGNPAICRPCEGCMKLIQLYNIEEIVYNTNNGYAIERLNNIKETYESA